MAPHRFYTIACASSLTLTVNKLTLGYLTLALVHVNSKKRIIWPYLDSVTLGIVAYLGSVLPSYRFVLHPGAKRVEGQVQSGQVAVLIKMADCKQ